MFRREMGSKRGSLPPKEGDLTCMHCLFVSSCKLHMTGTFYLHQSVKI